MCLCLCLTNVIQSKNYLEWERTKKATGITKQQHFHQINRRTLAVKYHFFFNIRTVKSYSNLKNTKLMGYNENFFHTIDVKSINTIGMSQVYSVPRDTVLDPRIWLMPVTARWPNFSHSSISERFICEESLSIAGQTVNYCNWTDLNGGGCASMDKKRILSLVEQNIVFSIILFINLES